MIERAQLQQGLITIAETDVFTLGRGNLQTIVSHGCKPIAYMLRGVIKTTLSAAFVRRGLSGLLTDALPSPPELGAAPHSRSPNCVAIHQIPRRKRRACSAVLE